MIRKSVLALLLAVSGVSAHAALSAGDIAFTAFNADEDGLSFVTFTNIAANTTIYFSDNEWTGAAFNTGESYSQWNSGSSNIAAGTVIRLLAYDSATNLKASIGSLSRVSVSSNTNWGLSTSADTVYAYVGSSATAPTTFLAAISNAPDGSLAGTGLIEGVNAILLNKNATSTSPDYGVYNGVRAGEISFDAYKAKVSNVANWSVDATNGNYAAAIPDTTNFSVTAVPEPKNYAMLLAGLGLIAAIARRRSR